MYANVVAQPVGQQPQEGYQTSDEQHYAATSLTQHQVSNAHTGTRPEQGQHQQLYPQVSNGIQFSSTRNDIVKPSYFSNPPSAHFPLQGQSQPLPPYPPPAMPPPSPYYSVLPPPMHPTSSFVPQQTAQITQYHGMTPLPPPPPPTSFLPYTHQAFYAQDPSMIPLTKKAISSERSDSSRLSHRRRRPRKKRKCDCISCCQVIVPGMIGIVLITLLLACAVLALAVAKGGDVFAFIPGIGLAVEEEGEIKAYDENDDKIKESVDEDDFSDYDFSQLHNDDNTDLDGLYAGSVADDGFYVDDDYHFENINQSARTNSDEEEGTDAPWTGNPLDDLVFITTAIDPPVSLDDDGLFLVDDDDDYYLAGPFSQKGVEDDFGIDDDPDILEDDDHPSLASNGGSDSEEGEEATVQKPSSSSAASFTVISDLTDLEEVAEKDSYDEARTNTQEQLDLDSSEYYYYSHSPLGDDGVQYYSFVSRPPPEDIGLDDDYESKSSASKIHNEKSNAVQKRGAYYAPLPQQAFDRAITFMPPAPPPTPAPISPPTPAPIPPPTKLRTSSPVTSSSKSLTIVSTANNEEKETVNFGSTLSPEHPPPGTMSFQQYYSSSPFADQSKNFALDGVNSEKNTNDRSYYPSDQDYPVDDQSTGYIAGAIPGTTNGLDTSGGEAEHETGDPYYYRGSQSFAGASEPDTLSQQQGRYYQYYPKLNIDHDFVDTDDGMFSYYEYENMQIAQEENYASVPSGEITNFPFYYGTDYNAYSFTGIPEGKKNDATEDKWQEDDDMYEDDGGFDLSSLVLDTDDDMISSILGKPLY